MNRIVRLLVVQVTTSSMLVSIYTSNEILEHRQDESGAGRAGIKNPGVHHG